jgi:hypothetical protein
MRLPVIALTALAFPMLGHAAIAGDWAGVLTFPKSSLRFVLHVSGPDNSLRAIADSPGHGVGGGSFVDSIALSGSTLSFTIQYLDVKFSGDVDSNGTIVGTFVQHGTGEPLVLTRTIAAPVPSRILVRPPLLVTGGVFHHDRSGIDLTLPDGWSVQGMETATNDPGEMAVLADAGHRTTWASVWMFRTRTETHPADIRNLLDDGLARKIASRTGKKERLPDEAVVENYKIRPGTVEHILVNGQQALRAIGEYKDAGEPITELLVWIYTEHARAYFDLRAQASKFETVQPAFEQLIQAARIP